MSERKPIEFGKRRPVQPLPPQPPAKRSGHVALLVTGTLAVGGGAYALMPRESCGPGSPAAVPPGMATPALPQTMTPCSPSRGSSGSGGGYRRSSGFSFFGGDSSSSHSSSAGSSDAGSGGVTRGGFGSLAHAFGFSGRG
jgi:hypothetical protein